MFYTGKSYRIELYDDHKSPLTNVRSVYAANKDRYPAYDLIVTNAHWYASGAKPCGNYKVNGTILSQEDAQCLGFYWNAGKAPTMGWSDLKSPENFVGTIAAIYNGALRNVTASVWGAGVCRPCGRTALGYKSNGDIWMLCTGDALTPSQVATKAQNDGVTNLVILDGSGSSQWCTKDGYYLGDKRTIYSYLLLWIPKFTTTACPYMEPKMNIRSGSSGIGAKWVQWMLNRNGANLIVDGAFGSKSVSALRSFQASHGLVADGICGKMTRDKLKVAANV